METEHNLELDLATHKVIEANRRSFSETRLDILKRMIGIANQESLERRLSKRATVKSRSTGNFEFTLFSEHLSAKSMKEAYVDIVLLLSKRSDQFLTSLSKRKTRNRRLIAREPTSLYENSPHLAADFAEKLTDDGWWIDTNLSREQVDARLKIACDVAGIVFGDDLKPHF